VNFTRYSNKLLNGLVATCTSVCLSATAQCSTGMRLSAICILVTSASATSISGNQPLRQDKISGFDSLVRQLAGKFTDVDRKGVLVMDLKPAVGEDGAFGGWLAEQIASFLAKSDQLIALKERSRLAPALYALNLKPTDEFHAESAIALANVVGAHTVIIGSYGAAENGVGLTLAAFRASEFARMQSTSLLIGMVSGKVSLVELGGHLDVPLDSLKPKDGIYNAGVGGVSIPSVIKIFYPSMKVPDIDLQGLLREKRQGGTIVLGCVITPDGRATQITVYQGIGFGVDEQYVKALRNAEFSPAVDADGKVLTARFQMTFAINIK
jgi:TonB family protein